jgi:hypothetical protein
MKNIILGITLFLSAFCSKAQIEENCSEKCNRAFNLPAEARISYYQYVSMNDYDVRSVKLEIAAETGSRSITGISTTRIRTISSMDSFVTEFKSTMIVDSLKINGVSFGYNQAADHIFVPLGTNWTPGSEKTIVIYYRGVASSLGVYAGTLASSSLNYVATLSESYQAREWFPCKQFLSDFIDDSTEVWITTSNTNKAGANGVLVGVDTLPSSKLRFRWISRHPMNYYNPSFAVGNYQDYRIYAKPAAISPDSILIQNYVSTNPTYFNSVKTNIDKTAPFLEKMSELFGIYPFYDEKYGHAMAGIGGGMEHQTMSTMNSFGSTLIAHELGHQWWGDYVTCKTWNDIWLNEGFASYCEYLMIEKLPLLFPTTNPSSYMLNVHNSVKSAATGSVRVPDASLYDEGRIFSSRLSYNKGSAIIHNLRFEIQDDSLFFRTLRTFLNTFRNRAATTADFVSTAETVCGRSFTNFFTQWYNGEGFPTHNITYFKPNSNTLLLLVSQTTSAPSITPLFTGKLELKITSLDGDTTIIVNINENNQVFQINNYVKTPSGVVVDPNNWVVNNTGIVTNGVVVPVTMKAFSIQQNQDCQYRLNWVTENETNISSYQIEQADESRIFKKIGTVSAAGRTRNEYNFVSEKPIANISYFRIKIISSDGNFNFTDILSRKNTCHENTGILVYPNPFNDELQVEFTSSSVEKIEMRLLDQEGKTLKKNNRTIPSGFSKIIWGNLKALPAGSYILHVVKATGEKISIPVVKQ